MIESSFRYKKPSALEWICSTAVFEHLPLLTGHFVLLRDIGAWCPLQPIGRWREFMPVFSIEGVVSKSASRSRHLLEHEWQPCGFDFIPQVGCPGVFHRSATILVLQFRLPIRVRRPQIFFSRAAFPASYKPMEAVQVYMLGNILKQWLRTDPADSGRNASEGVHFV